jgi:hypothetical protein
MSARRQRMVCLGASVAVAALLTAGAAPAHAARGDTYYTVVCDTPDGSVQAESVDAHAVQFDKTPGGKDGAVEQFNAHYPFDGWDCSLTGPFNAP